MQCTKIAYLVIIFYIIRNINIWKQFDLDYILELEDRVFEDAHVNQALAVDELPLNISTEGVYLPTKMLVRERNLFGERNDLFANYKKYTESEITNMASFTCAVFSIGIIWWNNSVCTFFNLNFSYSSKQYNTIQYGKFK